MIRLRISPVIQRLSLALVALLIFTGAAAAAPVEFNLPAQSADTALLAFSRQSREEVFFPLDEVRRVQTPAVAGLLEPAVALERLLAGTGFSARRNGAGKFIVTRTPPPVGSLAGRVLGPDNAPMRGAQVAIPGLRKATSTDRRGEFDFGGLAAGSYTLVVTAPGHRPQEVSGVRVPAGQRATLEPLRLAAAAEATLLEPFLVEAKLESVDLDRAGSLVAGAAADNLDLPRQADGPLPFTIYDREQIARTGVVDLNEFLQRKVLESDAATPSPEAAPDTGTEAASLATGGSRLRLRGYESDETVILVNGRSLPEVLTAFGNGIPAPDVNFIPLSLVQRVEILPVSASALYSGNAVGGVINIILRPEADRNATEIATTYTNALGGFHAPQHSLSLMHARTLLGGALRLRLSASFTRTTPPAESELGYRQARPGATEPLFRATPNLRSAGGGPLFGPGSASFTSVAPGADGSGGAAAFAGREGVRNLALLDTPGGLAASSQSLDYAYGREQRRSTLFSSAVYDVAPWLQIGADLTAARTTIRRGFDVFAAELTVPAGAPGNPFGQDVVAALQDAPVALGENYSEARLAFSSLVVGAVLKPLGLWRVALDGQYAHNVTQYRGLAGADLARWQELVNQGRYSVFRDTQVHGPPPAFYDEVLVHYGSPGSVVTLGDYTTLDAAVRLTQPSLGLPTGPAAVNVGADYRRTQLEDFRDERRHGDGTAAAAPVRWTGRTLQRYSAFGELQAPLQAAARLGPWLRAAEVSLAVRYVAADTAEETNLSPTFGLRLDLAGGFSARASVTTASRFPTPFMSHKSAGGGGVGVGIPDPVEVTDPVRGERYVAFASDFLDPSLRPEAAVTQSAGLAYQRGSEHHLRLGLDFLDTRKVDESIVVGVSDVVNLEGLWPQRVVRAAAQPGDPGGVGRIQTVLTGRVNAAWRHSQSVTSSLDYAWTAPTGGLLEVNGRWVQFLRYDRQLQPATAVIDQLGSPDTISAALVKHRASLAATWSRSGHGVGLDAQYLHPRVLPAALRAAQGRDRIGAYWGLDAFVQSDVSRWVPGPADGFSLRAQLRVNNVLGTDFPRFEAHSSGAGVQPYGDWRGRTYSLSVTATF